MAQLLSMALLGFFLGMRHATDPDHVIAVTTIVSRERRIGRAAGIGVLWGLGHTVTLLMVGGAILLFDIVIPPRVGLTMEFSVAVMLVLLGMLSLTGVVRPFRGESRDAPVHAHEHADSRAMARLDRWFGRLSLYQAWRPLAIGVVHGLAGSAAVALLVLATIRDAAWGVVYLGVFGIGTMTGMMLITAAIGLPFAFTSRRRSWFNRSLGVASSLLSLGFGFFLIYQVGFVGGLFSGHPQWTPR